MGILSFRRVVQGHKGCTVVLSSGSWQPPILEYVMSNTTDNNQNEKGAEPAS